MSNASDVEFLHGERAPSHDREPPKAPDKLPAEGLYGRAKEAGPAAEEIAYVDSEKFFKEQVKLRKFTREASRQRLEVAQQQSPEIYRMTATIAGAFQSAEQRLQQTQPSGEPAQILWGIFGSAAYQMDTGSRVTHPQDIDGFFDGAHTAIVYDVLKEMAQRQEGGIVDVEEPQIMPTGASRIQIWFEIDGKRIDAEFFGQQMRDPAQKQGYINVGTGDRSYTLNELELSTGDGESLPVRYIESADQAVLYTRRTLIEFQAGLENTSAEEKLKVSRRLFYAMRLMGEYHSAEFHQVIKNAVSDVRHSGQQEDIRALRDIRDLFDEFTGLVGAVRTQPGPAIDFDALEENLIQFTDQSIADAKRMTDLFTNHIPALQAKIHRHVPELTAETHAEFESLKQEVEALASTYQNLISGIDDYAQFAFYVQAHQIQTNFINPVLDTLDQLEARLPEAKILPLRNTLPPSAEPQGLAA